MIRLLKQWVYTRLMELQDPNAHWIGGQVRSAETCSEKMPHKMVGFPRSPIPMTIYPAGEAEAHGEHSRTPWGPTS